LITSRVTTAWKWQRPARATSASVAIAKRTSTARYATIFIAYQMEGYHPGVHAANSGTLARDCHVASIQTLSCGASLVVLVDRPAASDQSRNYRTERTVLFVDFTTIRCIESTHHFDARKTFSTHGGATMKGVLSLAATVLLCVLGVTVRVAAQEQPKESKPAEAKATSESAPPKEESRVTDHTIRLGGQTIPYKATASTTLIKDEKGEPAALIYSTAYTRSDIKDLTQRPLAFLYNGGPGSSSIWLHMGAFGPRRVVTIDAAPTPPPPFQLADNGDSLLERADLVFIDPVGTGFSHAAGKVQDKDFWGIDEDVKSLAQFISIYVTRNNRWNSPKFLIGESYGTFRSAALGNYLQSHDGIYLNGIVLISSVLDLTSLSFNPGDDMPYIYYLPSYAATAWYHKLLKDRPEDLNGFIAEARRFASTEYAGALMKGSNLSDAEKSDMARKLAHFTGLSEDYLTKANLRVTLAQFREELQRSRGLTTGRLDARYSGPMYDLLSEKADYDPQSTAVSGAFTAAFNNYIREDLKFGQDKTYKVWAEDAGREWNWKHSIGDRAFFPSTPNVEQDLVEALITNPHLYVEVENGLYDLATPFFATEYTMDHLGLPRNLRQNIQLRYYDAGHMMYLRVEDLAKLRSNIDAFIEGAAAK
jgi:carboxypeptidase C (cathepsin A)